MSRPSLEEVLALALVDDLFQRRGRFEGETLGGLVEGVIGDSGLLSLRSEWRRIIATRIKEHLDETPMELIAPVLRSPCRSRPPHTSRCDTHGAAMGADLRCDVGRGGPLKLPKPTAQQRPVSKSAKALKSKAQPRARKASK